MTVCMCLLVYFVGVEVSAAGGFSNQESHSCSGALGCEALGTKSKSPNGGVGSLPRCNIHDFVQLVVAFRICLRVDLRGVPSEIQTLKVNVVVYQGLKSVWYFVTFCDILKCHNFILLNFVRKRGARRQSALACSCRALTGSDQSHAGNRGPYTPLHYKDNTLPYTMKTG